MKDNFKIPTLGEHFKFSLREDVTEKDKALDYIRSFIRKSDVKALKLLVKSGLLLDFSCKKNLIATVGKAVFTERMAGGVTYTGEITDGALGNGSSPVFSASDVALKSEVGRKQASDSSFDDNIAYIDFFFASGDIADGTYTEWGTFIDGDGSTPDDGQAFSLLATGGWVKSGSLYISSKYTLT